MRAAEVLEPPAELLYKWVSYCRSGVSVFAGAAARVRGQSHRKDHTPCQDAARVDFVRGGDMDRIGDLAIGVVSDGGGSRPLSHIGSRFTVTVAAMLIRNLWSARLLEGEHPDHLAEFWRQLFADCRTALELEARLRDGEEPDGRANIGPYAGTLLAYMATRNRVSASQVGDGFIVLGRRMRGAVDYSLMFQNPRHAEAGQVVWLTSGAWESDLRTGTMDATVDLVLASSDGMDKAVLTAERRPGAPLMPHPPYFSKLHAGLAETAQEPRPAGETEEAALADYLHRSMSLPSLDMITDDDKAMAAALWIEPTVMRA